MEAWGYLIAVVIGVVLSEAIRWFRDWREGEEKYRVMLYEKRLEAHQMAFYLIRELNGSFPGSIEDMDEDRVASIEKARAEVDKWWASHCFYLDPKSRDKIMEAIVRSEELVRDYGLPKDPGYKWGNDERKSWSKERMAFTFCIDKTRRTLVEGIGMKHIEEPKKERPEGES